MTKKVFQFYYKKNKKGPAEIRTRVGGFKVLSDNQLHHKTNYFSTTGTRTRVNWVKASYPNHLDYCGGTLSETRTRNPRIRSPMRYPLRH